MKREIKRYGWLPSLPDPNDILYKVTAPIPLPDSVDLSDGFPGVYNQLSLGACTGNGISGIVAYKLKAQGLPFFIPSRLFIYFNERSYEGTIHYDAGAMIRDGIKSVSKGHMGVCDEKLWDYDIERFAEQPSSEAFVEALKHTVSLYEKLDNTVLYALQQCLAKGNPFVFGFSVFENFESGEISTNGIMGMPHGKMLGGHCVVGCGYDNKTQMIKCRNSWGDGWGDKGYFYMPFDYITNPDLCSDFWTIDAI